MHAEHSPAVETRDNPLISVIIVNWNGCRYLGSCLESLVRQSYKSLEIIVVDNGSTDGSVALLKSRYADNIRLIENNHNYGFAKGVNIGIQGARGEYIALLNTDAVAESRWLEELIKGFGYAEGTGMCASKIYLLEKKNIIDKVGHLMYPDGLNAGRGLGEEDRGQYDSIEETLFPDGCAALYRKRMLDEIGLFDEQFFAYGDDAELGMRARLFGWNCLYVPSAVVYHTRSGTLGKFSPRKAFLVERNRLWLAVKLFPLPILLISPFFTFARFFWHAYGVMTARGSAGRFVMEHSRVQLLLTLLKAYMSAAEGLPEIIKKRKELNKRKRISNREFYRLLQKFRVSARELALRER